MSGQSSGSEPPSFTLLPTEPLELRARKNRAFSCLNYSTLLLNSLYTGKVCAVRARPMWVHHTGHTCKTEMLQEWHVCGMQKVKAEAVVVRFVCIRSIWWQCLLQACPLFGSEFSVLVAQTVVVCKALIRSLWLTGRLWSLIGWGTRSWVALWAVVETGIP